MKHIRRFTAAALSAILSMTALLPLQTVRAAEPLPPFSLSESTETITNPGMGYTTTVWYRCKPENTPVLNPTGAIVLMFVDIGAFSSGENGSEDADGNYIPGTDYPLDSEFFEGLRGTLENCRRNGCTVALRFRYDDDGTRNPEPATFEMLKDHIRQIDEDGFLRDYQDILMFVESGFVGCYGEQWGGKYCSLEQKAELLELMLNVVPPPVSVTVRTPNIFAQWAGIKQAELGQYELNPDSAAARVGLYDDGYMGSDSDLGTYANREAETTWLGQHTQYAYFGGEFSGDLEFAQKYDTYLPQNAIPEMYKTHLSYINSNIFKLYQDYTFSAEYDVQAGDHSAYYGETVFKFIRDHLGYRFVLRGIDLPESAPQGGDFQAAFTVENTGFANPIREQQAEILLERDGSFYRAPLDFDSRECRSCTVTEKQFTVNLPGCLEAGNWDVYLKLSVGDHGKDSYSQIGQRSVRFANDGVWHSGLGANYLGNIRITDAESEQDQNKHALGIDGCTGDGILYSIRDVQITDGAISTQAEIDENILRADTGTVQLYLTGDEKNLYVRTLYPEAGEAPVWNLQFTNAMNGEQYWIYYASNGYVYFNHGTPVGCLHRHGMGCSEFQIPLGDVMGLEPGVTLKNVRFFLQDSAHDWELLEDIRCETYTLDGTFPVFNARKPVLLFEGEYYGMCVCTDIPDGKYQWYHDGKPIEGATEPAYMLENASSADKGVYSVRITNGAGMETTADVTDVLDVVGMLMGDVNDDGKVNRQDVLSVMQFLVTETDNLPIPFAADLDGDGLLTARDLSLLKAMLLA